MAITIRELGDGDEGRTLEALNAFCALRGQGAGGAQQRSAEEWRWAYAANPAGRRHALALDGESVVGHFGAMPRTVWLDDREIIFAEITDAFVLPEYRQGLATLGVFGQLGRSLIETHGGIEGDFTYYGWPTPGEWRVGKTVLDYEVVRTQCVLRREPGPGPGELPDGVELLERFDHQARWLWDRCCVAFGASAIRDEAFLNWRFVERPGHDYRILGVRDGEGVLRGYAVYRPGDWLEANTGWICDWLVPPEEPEVGELLMRGVLALARAGGQPSVANLLPEWSPWFDTFQRWGFRVVDSDTFLYARHFARKFDMLWLRAHWWMTLADSTVV